MSERERVRERGSSVVCSRINTASCAVSLGSRLAGERGTSAACTCRLSFVRSFVEPAAVGSVFTDTMSVPPLLQLRRSRHRTCRRELG